MNIPSSDILRRAISITTEIEKLDEELQRLLMGARSGGSDIGSLKNDSSEVAQAAKKPLSTKTKKKVKELKVKQPKVETILPPSIVPQEDIVIEVPVASQEAVVLEIPVVPQEPVIIQESVISEELVVPSIEVIAEISELTHHEQQCLLIDDSGEEPLALVNDAR